MKCKDDKNRYECLCLKGLGVIWSCIEVIWHYSSILCFGILGFPLFVIGWIKEKYEEEQNED